MADDFRAGLDPSVEKLQSGAERVFDSETSERMQRYATGLTRHAGRALGDLTADQPILFGIITLIAGIFLGRRLRG